MTANQSAPFEEAVLPHLDAAFNLARWLVRESADAQDLVQEAYLRAWKGFAGFHGGDARTWILTIVRNTCYTWLRKHSRQNLAVEFDEGIHSGENLLSNPERMFIQEANRGVLEQALHELPAEFRESIVLRELEGLSYKEISEIAGVPLGTVIAPFPSLIPPGFGPTKLIDFERVGNFFVISESTCSRDCLSVDQVTHRAAQ